MNEPGSDPRRSGLHDGAGIVLEEHQVELLRALVEAHRRATPRREFHVLMAQSALPDFPVEHPGLTESLLVTMADLRLLHRAGFIDLQQSHSFILTFTLLSPALAYYSNVLQRQGQPAERVEHTIRRLISSEGFRARYPAAYAKWVKAEELLWAADAQSQLTAIGHHCREAAQDFATALVSQHQPPDCPPDATATVARVRAVLNLRRSSLPSTVHPFLDALLTYWGTVMDLHQRQEHGAQREGQPLTWEDGRLVVFQTLLVMYELDRLVSAKP